MDSKRKSDDIDGDAAAKKLKHDRDIEVAEEDIDPMLAWGRPTPPPIDPKTYSLGNFYNTYHLALSLLECRIPTTGSRLYSGRTSRRNARLKSGTSAYYSLVWSYNGGL
jgi:hypothetical protein